MDSNNLFLSTQEYKTPLIVLIDASGSTKVKFMGNQDVFDKMSQILKELPNEEFRFIFWNSDNPKPLIDNKFANGLYKIPYIIKKNNLEFTFNHAKTFINESCLTMTYLAFESIPEEWFDKTGRTRICLLTDGQMGWMGIPSNILSQQKDRLRDSIIKVCQNHVDVQLDIITVETTNYNFDVMESTERVAGSDIYSVITSSHLSKYVNKYMSYTPNNLNGFVHINKVIAPPGFLPYGDQYFSEQKIGQFMAYLIGHINNFNLVENASEKENLYLKEIQKLSATIGKLVSNKSPNVKRDIINNFCTLFANAPFDQSFIKFVLTESVEKENQGSAQLFTQYRHSMKTLYTQANNLLLNNTFDSIGLKDQFMTLPYNSHIFTGCTRMVTESIQLDTGTHKLGGIDILSHKIPVLPFESAELSPMSEQCIRQYVRGVVHQYTGIPTVEDKIIYVVLGYVLNVVASDATDPIKNEYRKLGHIMLKKKSIRTLDITELQNLESGELPVSRSGKIDKFYECMEIVRGQLGITDSVHPMTIWYGICLALNNSAMIVKQLLHCKEYIEKDFANVEPSNLLNHLKPLIKTVYTFTSIPNELLYDYNCLITLDDVSNVGGVRILPHTNLTGSRCSPMYVLSNQGHQQLVSDVNQCICPICYKQLALTDFEAVGPKPNISWEGLFKETDPKYFVGGYKTFKPPTLNYQAMFTSSVTSSLPSSAYSSIASSSTTIPTNPDPYTFAKSTQSKPLEKVTLKPPKSNLMLVMKGVVGSGKTTLSNRLKTAIEEKGYVCVIEGVDQHCIDGMTTADAVSKVAENLKNLSSLPDDTKLVVIIDTCGENSGKKTTEYFGINFIQWNRVMIWPNYNNSTQAMLPDYFAWTLKNVLERPKRSPNCTYFLNSEDASFETCVEVHKRKARQLLGKRPISNCSFGSMLNKQSTLLSLNERASRYAKYLEESMSLDKQVQDIMTKHVEFYLSK